MREVPEWLHQLLKEFSTDRFHPDYNGYLYNHTYQGIISVWRLGASQTRTRQFAETYVRQLEPARLERDQQLPGVGALCPAELKDLLGKRQKYLHLVAHFRQLLLDVDNDYQRLVNEQLPALVPGLGSAASHGLIQLGYGYLVKNERVLCEGLAYIHFSYIPQVVSAPGSMAVGVGEGQQDLVEVLREVSRDTALLDFVDTNPMVFNDDRDEKGDFLGRMHSVLGKKGDLITQYVKKIRFPDWFRKDMLDSNQLTKLTKWLVDSAILVYVMLEAKNDFFLLHAVTGAAGLRQILPLLQSAEEALKTVAYFLSAFIGVYIGRRCPELKEGNTRLCVTPDWDAIRNKVLGADLDEHVYKLVDVGLTRHEESDRFIQPEIYFIAAQIASEYPLLKD